MVKKNIKNGLWSIAWSILGLIIFICGIFSWRYFWDSPIVFPLFLFIGIIATIILGLGIIIREISKWVEL